MNCNVLEDYYNDPTRYRRLAQRERARAIREGLAALRGGLVRLFATLRSHFVARIHVRPARWIARLG